VSKWTFAFMAAVVFFAASCATSKPVEEPVAAEEAPLAPAKAEPLQPPIPPDIMPDPEPPREQPEKPAEPEKAPEKPAEAPAKVGPLQPPIPPDIMPDPKPPKEQPEKPAEPEKAPEKPAEAPAAKPQKATAELTEEEFKEMAAVGKTLMEAQKMYREYFSKKQATGNSDAALLNRAIALLDAIIPQLEKLLEKRPDSPELKMLLNQAADDRNSLLWEK
jgi:hypothetical protein